jgi:hypothetical protein
VKIVLLRFALTAALSMSLGFVCCVAHAQSWADFRVADTACAFAAVPAAAFTQSFPPTDASLFTSVSPDRSSLSSSLISASAPGDLGAYSPEASAAEAVPSRAAWPAASTPEPKPSPYYEQFPRKWELGLAFALVRFRSSIYYASAPGLNSSLTYWWKDRIAFEGSVTSAFAPPVFANEHFRYLGYGAGPKFSFGSGRLEPWAHALVGGVHLIPQTASGGKNGFEVTMGGGVDYAINDVISAKGGVDYLGTHMFGQWQSSVQVVAGLSLRF